jgi:hypothetical protein
MTPTGCSNTGRGAGVGGTGRSETARAGLGGAGVGRGGAMGFTGFGASGGWANFFQTASFCLPSWLSV